MQGIGALIFKIACLGILFIAFVIGVNAHEESAWTTRWKVKGTPESCALNEKCPSNAFLMELLFIVITALYLLLSLISVIYGICKKSGSSATIDTGYNAVAGLVILIAGILMIVAAVQIENFFNPLSLSSSTPGVDAFRKSVKYADKLAAGAIAIVDGLLYFAAAGIIHSSS